MTLGSCAAVALTIAWSRIATLSMLYSLAAWLVNVQGRRTALLMLALILAPGTIAAHAPALRRRPEELGLRPDDAAAPPNDRPAPPATERSITRAEALRGTAY